MTREHWYVRQTWRMHYGDQWVAQPWRDRSKTQRGESTGPPVYFATHAQALAYAVEQAWITAEMHRAERQLVAGLDCSNTIQADYI